jgi:5-methyltetrahydropteroyltriglutamate--homocysteine methyltransferase
MTGSPACAGDDSFPGTQNHMPRTKPPFRADHVGSLLRPAVLKQARAQRERGEITAEELKTIEDREIEAVIRKQEEAGLRSVTDGEFRRAFWNYDFLKFVAAHAKATTNKATPKMTVPSPSSLHFRYGRDAVPVEIYPDMDDFYRDLGEGYRKALRAFSDAGCRYLQLDEVNFTYLCDPKLRAFVANRGEDPETLPHVYARMINAALSDVAPDVTKAMHLCRGNFQSTFVASGGYEPVAEILFNEINIDAYFMEYDSDRAGGFAPLRFVPKGKMVVLGLVTSKSGTLESKDELKRRIDQAARYIDLDQLCLSPQCGFASTEEGNILAEDEQWAKLRRIVEVADEVWG